MNPPNVQSKHKPGLVMAVASPLPLSSGTQFMETRLLAHDIHIITGASKSATVRMKNPDARGIVIVDMNIHERTLVLPMKFYGKEPELEKRVRHLAKKYKSNSLTAELIQKALMPETVSSGYILPSPRVEEGKWKSRKFTPDFYREVIHILKGMFDVVILDTPLIYGGSPLAELAYKEADIVGAYADMDKFYEDIYMRCFWAEHTTKPESEGGVGIPIEKVYRLTKRMVKNSTVEDYGALAAWGTVHTAHPSYKNQYHAHQLRMLYAEHQPISLHTLMDAHGVAVKADEDELVTEKRYCDNIWV